MNYLEALKYTCVPIGGLIVLIAPMFISSFIVLVLCVLFNIDQNPTFMLW